MSKDIVIPTDLIAFFALYILTCVLLFFIELTAPLAGLLLALWGAAACARALWIAETLFLLEDLDQKQRRPLLPWVLVEGMNLKSRLERGFKAMRACDPAMKFLLAAAVLFVLWSVHVQWSPAPPASLMQIQARIDNFFETYHPDLAVPRFSYDMKQWLVGMSVFFMGGYSFWVLRSYAAMAPGNLALLFMAAILFFGCALGAFIFSGLAEGAGYLAGSWKGYGYGPTPVLHHLRELEGLRPSSFFLRSAESGVAGIVFLYIPGVLMGLIFLKNALQTDHRRRHALAGLLVLAILVLMDKGLAAGPAMNSVFISGWGLLAVLWQGSQSRGIKSFTMRQI